MEIKLFSAEGLRALAVAGGCFLFFLASMTMRLPKALVSAVWSLQKGENMIR